MLRRARFARASSRRLLSDSSHRKKPLAGGLAGVLRGSRVVKQGQDLQLTELIQANQKARAAAAAVHQQRLDEVVDENYQVVEKELALAAQTVAASLQSSSARSDLLGRLAAMEKETFEGARPASLFSSLSRLKLETRPRGAESDASAKSGDLSAELQARKFLDDIDFKMWRRHDMTQPAKSPREQGAAPASYQPVDVYGGGGRLGIFPSPPSAAARLETTPPWSSVWARLELARLRRLLSLAPRNGFEEMVEWTENGKIPPYPVDNEFGLDEKRVAFHEHVFLHRLLEGQEGGELGEVPREGPVRDFLDLVLAGLSRNPFMALERKRDHLVWFRRFFRDRQAELEKLRLQELSLAHG